MYKPSIRVALTAHGKTTEYTKLALDSLKKNSTLDPSAYVYEDDTRELDPDAMPTGVSFRFTDFNSWIRNVNAILQEWYGENEEEYLVISNNDVVFMPEWDAALMRCFVQNEDCGIAGPVTNQPGHQPMQMVEAAPLPADDMGQFVQYRKNYMETVIGLEKRDQVLKTAFVNGFCFMLKRDRLLLDPKGKVMLFEGVDGHSHYGGEDLYQARMREKGEFYPYIVAESWVYHFKDVTMNSAARGRMGLDPDKLPRLK